MPASLKALRLLHLMVGGGLTSAQLQSELTSPGSLGAFEAALLQRHVANLIKQSSSARAMAAGASHALQAMARQEATVLEALLDDASARGVLLGDAAVFAAVASLEAARARLLAHAPTMAGVAASAALTNALLNDASARADLLAHADAMAAIAANATAVNALIAHGASLSAAAASAPAATALATSATAMAVVAANAPAVSALIATAAGRAALHGADTALAALAANPTAKAALRAAPQLTTTWQNFSAGVAGNFNGIAWPAILVGWSTSAASSTITINAGRRAGSSVGALSAPLPNGTTASGDNLMAVVNPLNLTATSGGSVYLAYIKVAA